MQIGFDKYIEDLKKKWRFLSEIMGDFEKKSANMTERF